LVGQRPAFFVLMPEAPIALRERTGVSPPMRCFAYPDGKCPNIQAQMRHASVNTTANICTKPIAKSVRKAVEALDRRIRRRGQAKKS
jgi:hypothetical protein